MKKAICILCISAMLALVGCGSDNNNAAKGKTVDEVMSNAAKDSSVESSSAADISSESSSDAETTSSKAESVKYEKIDSDLAAMSDTMAYSELINMTNDPDKYKGKIIKAKGTFAVAEDNGNTYFACMLTDATACCSQPLEFVLADTSRVYPKDYPQVDSEITVIGKFGTYTEGGNMYFQLSDAQLL